MKCFYHSADLDGKCAGAVMKAKYPDCEMLPYNYNEPFPWDQIEDGEVVFMVDVSLHDDEMVELNQKCALTWIDHHVKIIEALNQKGIHIEGLQRVGTGACELAWEYCYPDSRVPRGIHLLALYDIWDHRDPEVMPFQYGMKALDNSVESSVWLTIIADYLGMDELGEGGVKDIIQSGRAIMDYAKYQNINYCKEAAYELKFHDMRCLVVNMGLCGSKIFDSMWDESRHDAMVTFYLSRHGFWSVSMYTPKEDFDVGNIARQYGGGGHKGAAGFELSTQELQDMLLPPRNT